MRLLMVRLPIFTWLFEEAVVFQLLGEQVAGGYLYLLLPEYSHLPL